MEKTSSFRRVVPPVLAQIVLLTFIAFCVLHSEGMGGVAVFVNLEAGLLVFGGAALLTWVRCLAQPGMDRKALIRSARSSAVGMGLLTATLGIILLLSSVDDVTQIPRRLALALTGLFFGLFLSEVILAPYEPAGRSGGGDPEPKALLGSAGLGLAMLLFTFFVLLYALTAPLAT